MAIRGLMGVAEGSFCPTSFAATADASHPRRRGLNLGLQQSGFALFAALSPIIATQLLGFVSWRWVFALVAVPGLILGAIMLFVIREPKVTKAVASEHAPASLGHVLKSRNILVAMAALCCAMTGVFVLGALLPLYLTDYLALGTQKMGLVVSAIGFGGFLGQFGLPGLSDLVGRRLASIVGFAGTAVMLYIFRGLGPQPLALFGVLFVASFFTLGLVSLLSGPVATEAAPIAVSTSIGVVVGVGEIFGGGIAPAMAATSPHTLASRTFCGCRCARSCWHRGQPAAEGNRAGRAATSHGGRATGTGSGRAIAVRPWAGWAVRAGRRHRRLTSIG